MPTTRRKTPEQLIAEMRRWPETWAGLPEHVPLGEGLVKCFAPFVRSLAASDLAPPTVRRHFDNLWTLGGYVVKQAGYYPENLERTAEALLDEELAPDEGPWIADSTEAEQRSLDATCRKFYKFRHA